MPVCLAAPRATFRSSALRYKSKVPYAHSPVVRTWLAGARPVYSRVVCV
eukprot:COSAG06_NODE_70076_length_194_cov_17.842105_1_plen_48_part_01